MERTGTVLDRKYQLLRLLGEGGMGSVYEARHAIIGRQCAVKFLHPEVARNPEVVQRFIREAQAASAIGHRNIIDIYDVGLAPDGAPYLVMEFLTGCSLAEELKDGRSLPPDDAAEVAAQVLSALAVAHRRGIVHRDLKPDNLYIVRPMGGAPSVKILDFGISKVIDPQKPEKRMTSTGAVLGTPHYMAPEQARGDRDVDHRIDLYAVGVILYETLTGKVPFEGENYNQLMLKILLDPFVPPRGHNPAIPEGLEQVVLHAMARAREARYQTADEMLGELTPFLTDAAQARLGFTGTGLGSGTRRRSVVAGRPGPVRSTRTPGAFATQDTAGVAGGRWLRFGIPAAVLVAALVVGIVVWSPWKRGAQPPPAGGPDGASAGPVLLAAARGGQDAGPGGTTAATRTVPPAEPPAAPVEPPTAPAAGPDAATPPPADAVAVAPPELPGAAVPPLPDVMVPKEPDDIVTISIANLPPGAEVFWGGDRVAGVPFTVPRQGDRVRLEVRAPGYQRESQLVVPDRDVTVTLALRATGHPGGPRERGDAGGAGATTAASPPQAAGAQDASTIIQGGRGTAISTGFQ